jgi:hypothetical protein
MVAGHEEHNKIIRGYDEALAIKAQKHEVYRIENEMRIKYDPQLKAVND